MKKMVSDLLSGVLQTLQALWTISTDIRRFKEVTSLFLGRFRLVFERIQNNGCRCLLNGSLWPGTNINL